MSEVAPPKREPASWRIWLFRILAALWGLYFGSNVAAVLGPWISSAPNGGMDPALGRWETSLTVGPDTLAGLVFLYVAWRPRRAALFLQWYVLSMVVLIVTSIPNKLGPPGFAVVLALFFLVPVFAYPWLRELLVPPWRDGVRWPLLVLALLAGPLLVADAWNAFQHVQGASNVAGSEWLSSVGWLMLLWIAMLVAASRRPSRNPLAVMVGADLLYLGAAAIALPHALGTWGYLWGSLSALAGLVYVVDVARERWMPARKSPTVLEHQST